MGDAVADCSRDLATRHSALHSGSQELAEYVRQGNLAWTSGDHAAALAAFEQALRCDPTQVNIWVAVCELLLQCHEVTPALDCLRQALQLDPSNLSARLVLGNLQKDQGEPQYAADNYRFILKHQPKHIAALLNLASVLRQEGNLDQALQLLAQAEAVEPASPLVAFNYGNALMDAGRLDDAADRYLSALPTHPRPAKVLFNLSGTTKFTESDRSRIAVWKQQVGARVNSAEDRTFFHFAQGKIADDLRDYDEAFKHYQQGNALVSVEFDQGAHAAWVEQTRKVWTADFLLARRNWGLDIDDPIFIVGMPRSGTTLVEQILAANSQVQAFGEREILGRLITEMGESLGCPGDTVATAARLTQADVHELAETYLYTPQRDIARPRFTDKMPANFLHLGWIAASFPNAKIIHCRRDPRDVCLSCYFQHFTRQLSFAYRLEDLVAYYQAYERLMQHWHTVLPGRILDVSYEQLVETPTSVIGELLKHCELASESACFESHTESRPVATASAWQVQQPIYRTSRRRWRNYAQHIEPLLNAFGKDT
ncbi:tetratricopeptide repeat-containing sulfotransferase family protein [Planctomicrobium piriforme]|uniref:Tfp pilus assembly protein PilF n=1 Tax=Planctomicrobium piriforme TaxID=1576369 RepID=A0A1I3EQE6_9PLAN|nr:sulfotransferase [Planctomicrobium piriforme]SFI00931.1 Tfp pilus assembly protein PilF [Planctomicrobium piriforme]